MSFESDSVNENFSPVRPHRRRRKFKRMDTDCQPIDEKLTNPFALRTPEMDDSLLNDAFASMPNAEMSQEQVMLTCGKRKRSSRERSLDMLEDCKLDGSDALSGVDQLKPTGTCQMVSK